MGLNDMSEVSYLFMDGKSCVHEYPVGEDYGYILCQHVFNFRPETTTRHSHTPSRWPLEHGIPIFPAGRGLGTAGYTHCTSGSVLWLYVS